jgi:hypothetical protein
MKLTKSDPNRSVTELREKTAKARASLINNCLAQIGTALNQTVTKDLKEVFCVGLADLTESQLKFGFGEALKFWKPEYGKKFPVPAEIREYAEQYVHVDPIAETRRLYLEREAKPADWEPVTEEELTEFHRQLKAAAASRQMPNYNEMVEAQAAERNGKSEVPKDPEAREEWRRELVAKRRAEPGYYESGAKR